MLTRIHVDNFRCLVNFDLKLDRLNLLLGENGSGKSTVFHVLRRLQDFLSGEVNVDSVFPSADLTRRAGQLCSLARDPAVVDFASGRVRRSD